MLINQHSDNDDADDDIDIDALIAARRYKQSAVPPPSSLQERTAPSSFNRQDDDICEIL